MEYVYWVIENKLAGRPGPVRHPWDARALYAGGIRVVVSLAAEELVEDLTAYGLEHYRPQLPPVLLFSVGMRKAFIHEALPIWAFIHRQVEASVPTLVHCHAGKDRTGVILAGYLITYLGMTVEDAIAKVRAANPEALSAFGYEEAVRLLQPGQLPNRKTLL
jgi:protein-tyrosine phosphatase